ncbi:hypothetical protein ACFLTD_05595, partial [Elusimicrobiota bacterium]
LGLDPDNLAVQLTQATVAPLIEAMQATKGVINCSTEALSNMLTQMGVSHSKEDIATSTMLVDILSGSVTEQELAGEDDLMTTMFALQKVGSEQYGIDLKSSNAKISDIKDYFSNGGDSILTHVGEDHYVVVTGLENGIVNYMDSDGQTSTMAEAEFVDWAADSEGDIDALADELLGEGMDDMEAQEIAGSRNLLGSVVPIAIAVVATVVTCGAAAPLAAAVCTSMGLAAGTLGAAIATGLTYAAVGTVVNTVASLAQGYSFSDSLKSGLMSGAMSGVGAGLGAAGIGNSFTSGISEGISNALGGGVVAQTIGKYGAQFLTKAAVGTGIGLVSGQGFSESLMTGAKMGLSSVAMSAGMDTLGFVGSKIKGYFSEEPAAPGGVTEPSPGQNFGEPGGPAQTETGGIEPYPASGWEAKEIATATTPPTAGESTGLGSFLKESVTGIKNFVTETVPDAIKSTIGEKAYDFLKNTTVSLGTNVAVNSMKNLIMTGDVNFEDALTQSILPSAMSSVISLSKSSLPGLSTVVDPILEFTDNIYNSRAYQTTTAMSDMLTSYYKYSGEEMPDYVKAYTNTANMGSSVIDTVRSSEMVSKATDNFFKNLELEKGTGWGDYLDVVTATAQQNKSITAVKLNALKIDYQARINELNEFMDDSGFDPDEFKAYKGDLEARYDELKSMDKNDPLFKTKLEEFNDRLAYFNEKMLPMAKKFQKKLDDLDLADIQEDLKEVQSEAFALEAIAGLSSAGSGTLDLVNNWENLGTLNAATGLTDIVNKVSNGIFKIGQAQ